LYFSMLTYCEYAPLEKYNFTPKFTAFDRLSGEKVRAATLATNLYFSMLTYCEYAPLEKYNFTPKFTAFDRLSREGYEWMLWIAYRGRMGKYDEKQYSNN
ncbi:MAG: hypothetical protein RSB32_08220, partial [Mucinivorans sp.]